MDTVKVLGQPYRPRVIDSELAEALTIAGAVVIEGARATGKTMTALAAAGSYAFVDDDEIQDRLAIAPQSVLEGASPRLLDEWQLAPQLWNKVRRAVDASPTPGRFILTGSATPADDATRHTGAGRMLRLKQRTLTWYEKSTIGHQAEVPATPPVSLRGLFAGESPAPAAATAATTAAAGAATTAAATAATLDLDGVIAQILTAGFPALAHLGPHATAKRMRGYIEEIARTDIHRIATIRHNPDIIGQLIAALARSVAGEVTYKTLAADVRAIAPDITAATVSNYVELLERLFIVEMQKPWTPKLRSRARLRTTPKVHLVDPAFAAAALGAGPALLHKDLHTLAALFESAVVHDLCVFAQVIDGQVRHYRDSNGKEIDAIITLPDGRWGAVEVKLGGRQAPAAVASLNNTIGDIDTAAVGEPSFRIIITGTGPTFVADDGTVITSLAHLGP